MACRDERVNWNKYMQCLDTSTVITPSPAEPGYVLFLQTV